MLRQRDGRRPAFSGILRGLQTAMRGWFGRLQTDVGQLGVPDLTVLDFPVPDWHIFGFVEQGTSAAAPIASGTALVIYTVPQDRRAYLDALNLERATGDNTIDQVRYTQPAGYGTGTRVGHLIRLATAAANTHWPNRTQTMTWDRPAGTPALLLEPGTTVDIVPAAAGVATTTWEFTLTMRLTPLVRAAGPS